MSVSQRAEWLHKRGLYSTVRRICEQERVAVADALGGSAVPRVVAVRVAAWQWLNSTGQISTEEIASVWCLPEAQVKAAIGAARPKKKPRPITKAESNVPADPAAWLTERGMLEDVQALCHGRATVAEIFSRQKDKRISMARWVVWAWLREKGWSYPDIGKAWGRNHATVIGGVKRLEAAKREEAA